MASVQHAGLDKNTRLRVRLLHSDFIKIKNWLTFLWHSENFKLCRFAIFTFTKLNDNIFKKKNHGKWKIIWCLVVFQDLHFSSAEFQQYIGRDFRFRASSARIPKLPKEQNCGLQKATWYLHHPSCFAVSLTQPRGSQFQTGLSLWPLSALKDCSQPLGSADEFKKLDCPRWGKSSSQPSFYPHHGEAGAWRLFFFFFDWIQVCPMEFHSYSLSCLPSISNWIV